MWSFLGFIFNGFNKNHLPGLINLTIPNISSDLLLIHLDKEGIAISNGSACSSGTISPSPVLKAMGISDKKNLESIRISAGKHNTIDEVNKAIDKLDKQNFKKLVFDLRGNSGGYLEQAAAVSNLFISTRDTLVYTKGKISDSNQAFISDPQKGRNDFSLIVLIKSIESGIPGLFTTSVAVSISESV